MCGIVGYTSTWTPAVPVVLEGLQRLEYRGYDSAGVAVLNGHRRIDVLRAVGRLDALAATMQGSMPLGQTAIGHTRWATHGGVTVDNAHPHTDCTGGVAVVHNGIVENHQALREELGRRGHRFQSETDTEVIPHLVEEALGSGKGFEAACRWAFGQLQGGQAIVAMHVGSPGVLVAARVGASGSITVARRPGEVLLASDLAALLGFSREVLFLRPGEIVVASPESVRIIGADGTLLDRVPEAVALDLAEPTLDGYAHYTLKEILGQGKTVAQALEGRLQVEPARVVLEEFPFSEEELRRYDRVVLLAMGTSYHAAQIGRFYMEELAGISAEVENASEFRYRNSLVNRNTLVIAITQSGETADTLAGMQEARERGASVIALCNVPWSQATWAADYTLYLRAGLERGVASTKCFTSSLVCLYLLAVRLAEARGTLDSERRQQALAELRQLPAMVGTAFGLEQQCRELAERFGATEHLFYLGRGLGYPLAMEGALKAKEISYIHAEGYPAGEMKHGPIALIGQGTPVVALALPGPTLSKMESSIAEVRARGARVIRVTVQGESTEANGDTIMVQAPSPLLAPIVASVPLQLLAYYMAIERGCDVDMPRNLAKSVTVE
jgi:glucosamine--fructose-6-phosphate aminotransferase (isomerizing)